MISFDHYLFEINLIFHYNLTPKQLIPYDSCYKHLQLVRHVSLFIYCYRWGREVDFGGKKLGCDAIAAGTGGKRWDCISLVSPTTEPALVWWRHTEPLQKSDP
jgi:hypothetical protein